MIGGETGYYHSSYKRWYTNPIATVYSFKSENGGKWVEEPYKMAKAKSSLVAMRVKLSTINSTCPGKQVDGDL